ncbi:DUF6777 domain-containing protein [Streptomyces noursei]|uniref:DUF6777 domain-containing protein n=1 Tax=Streptomyces noursei TaxID=1971 RepID=UPI00045F0A45|nr:DUF6777 domain-containing protein [Streptomyces noursei]AIA06763.1 hypothetical protein DC74_6326 [Streptomyces noursei]
MVVAVVLTRPGGGNGSAGVLHLESVAATGPAPFTDSTVNGDGTASPKATPSVPPSGDHRRASVSGAAPGLYGGSRDRASCDVEKQIRYLQADPAKARAFAGVVGKDAGELPAYLRSMTPVQLLVDTWVTNHGYQDGKATGYQAVLQAGTAVLVDAYGVPRVRCACGNPLTPPTATGGQGLTTQGKPWPGFRDANVVTVRPAAKPVRDFVLKDPGTGQYFTRPEGADGSTDQPSAPPSASPFSPSPASPSAPGSPGSPGNGSPSTPPRSPASPQSPGAARRRSPRPAPARRRRAAPPHPRRPARPAPRRRSSPGRPPAPARPPGARPAGRRLRLTSRPPAPGDRVAGALGTPRRLRYRTVS